MHRYAALAVVSFLIASGCATGSPDRVRPGTPADAPAGHQYETLNAVLWMQTSAEYEALARQTWTAATEAMRRELRAEGPSALVEEVRCAACPPAVIVDADETVLDNSAYDARRIVEGTEFDPAAWTAWVNERRAGAVPGALEFAREAERLGVRVFYVTNRTTEEEPGTVDNLRALGFPLPAGEDVVLTKGEHSATATSDKTERRRAVGARYRVLLLAGDDLNDFAPANLSLEDRRMLVERAGERWGRSWFMLPNPSYGSWERALLRDLPAGFDRDTRRREMLRHLDLSRP